MNAALAEHFIIPPLRDGHWLFGQIDASPATKDVAELGTPIRVHLQSILVTPMFWEVLITAGGLWLMLPRRGPMIG